MYHGVSHVAIHKWQSMRQKSYLPTITVPFTCYLCLQFSSLLLPKDS